MNIVKNVCKNFIFNKNKVKILLSENSRLKNFSTTTRKKMRFIQFKEDENSNENSIGLISDDGLKIKKIPYSNPKINSIDPMINYIEEQSNKPISVLTNELDEIEWDSISKNLILLSPVTKPEKIICIGLNYKDHCLEQNKEIPTVPMFFGKYTNSLVSAFGKVIAHPISEEIDFEVELAVVIGKTARNIERENAYDYVFGYCVAQDISARDWQKVLNGGQFLIGKSMDTFCPLGPAIVHKSIITDPHNLNLTCSINGKLKQESNTENLIYKIDHIIWHLSRTMTLKPGDVLLTGTPGGVGMYRNPPEFLKPGDIIETEIEIVGKMCNEVI